MEASLVREWRDELLQNAARLFCSPDGQSPGEAELPESEELVRTIAENSTHGLAMMDDRGYCTYANQAWLAMTGYSADEIGSRPLHDLVHHHYPDGRPYPVEECPINRALPGNFDVRAHEDLFFRKDGSSFLVTCAASPVFKDGRPASTVIEIRDITAQRAAENALLDSRAHLTALLEQSAAGICETDLGGRIISVNDRYCEILGRNRNVLTGMRMQDLTHPDDRAYNLSLFDTLVSTGQAFGMEKRYVRPDGSHVWVSVAVSLIRPGGGHVGESVLAIVLDTTERKRLEDQLQRLNETLEERVRARTRERDRLWEVSRDLIVIIGRDGRYKRVNPAWTNEMGHSEEDIIGIRFDELVHPDDRPVAQAGFDRLMAGAHNTSLEVRLAAQDGTYRNMSWIAMAAGNDLYASGRDVTEQRRMEEQLRQSQKMEAIGQLTGGIAHDFNNMLAGIMGNIEMLQFNLAQGNILELARYADGALKMVHRAASLTHRLLAFSRRQTLDPKPVDPNGLILSMEDMLRRTLGPETYLETALDGGIWTALCDPGQLENALLNLAINSRDAMPDGGRLTIETANVVLDRTAVAAFPDVTAGQYVRICVSDTGAGMTPEIASRAMEPFFTTKPLGQGTGLGLSMIYGFVKQSHGHLRIYSEPGSGTTVQLYLPRHAGAALPGDGDDAPPGEVRAEGRPVILLVEDEASIRAMATEMLGAVGYRVIEAADGAEGMAQLSRAMRVDLLVTDIGLPNGMNGRQLADAARQQWPDLKVLFITGFAENAAIGNHLLGPGMQVMTKPFSMAAFTGRIASIFRS